MHAMHLLYQNCNLEVGFRTWAELLISVEAACMPFIGIDKAINLMVELDKVKKVTCKVRKS
jgi:hypothetical protein